jgi:hypothetical protein
MGAANGKFEHSLPPRLRDFLPNPQHYTKLRWGTERVRAALLFASMCVHGISHCELRTSHTHVRSTFLQHLPTARHSKHSSEGGAQRTCMSGLVVRVCAEYARVRGACVWTCKEYTRVCISYVHKHVCASKCVTSRLLVCIFPYICDLR